MQAYAEEYRRSLADPAAFWREQAAAIDWYARPRTVLDREAWAAGHWFPDGSLNTAYNALDRHVVRGRADEPALVFHSARTGTRRSYSYADLLERVAQLGGALRELGVVAGDRVVIGLPMVPEVVFAMLACARIGAVHMVVPAGLPVAELAALIDDVRPKVVLIASCGLESGRVVEHKPLLDAALDKAAHQPDYCVVYQREQVRAELQPGRDLDLGGLMRPGQFPPAECTVLPAADPLYLLRLPGPTSGPGVIARDQGGHAVALAYAMPTAYGVAPGDVVLTVSDLSGGLAHSALVYGPLLVGATTVLYEGAPVGTPDAGSLWRAAAEHRATVVVTELSTLQTVREADPELVLARRYDLSDLQAVFVDGGPSDRVTRAWAADGLGVPVLGSWSPAMSGQPLAAYPRGLELQRAEPDFSSVPMPGFDVQVLDAGGSPVAVGEEGAVCIRLPLPPGTLPAAWAGDALAVSGGLESHAGFWDSGHRGYLDQNGSLHVGAATELSDVS